MSPRRITVHGMLQFGHGGEAVEMLDLTSNTIAIDRLQFGHGGEAVEMIPP